MLLGSTYLTEALILSLTSEPPSPDRWTRPDLIDWKLPEPSSHRFAVRMLSPSTLLTLFLLLLTSVFIGICLVEARMHVKSTVNHPTDIQQSYAFSSYFNSATLSLPQTDQLQTVALKGQNIGGQTLTTPAASIKPPVRRYVPTSSDPTVLVKPFAYIYISQDFNAYSHPGLDLVAAYGTPIVAVAAGCFVTASGSYNGGYGNLLIEDIGNGYTVRYAHLQRFADNIMSGTCVDAGQLIGYVGLTGRTTGPHLHFELRHYGVPVRPNL